MYTFLCFIFILKSLGDDETELTFIEKRTRISPQGSEDNDREWSMYNRRRKQRYRPSGFKHRAVWRGGYSDDEIEFDPYYQQHDRDVHGIDICAENKKHHCKGCDLNESDGSETERLVFYFFILKYFF